MKADTIEAVRKACQHLGGQANLANAVNITPAAVNQWLSGVRPVPAERVLAISSATNGTVTPHDLRPDLYPNPSWLPPELNDPEAA